MMQGGKIAREILTKLGYPRKIVDQVGDNVDGHDNWALGDLEIYRKDIVMGAFKDLDWLWTLTEKGFPAVMKVKNCSVEEMLA